MLNFFQTNNPKKEYVSCDWAEHGLNFHQGTIKTCCMLFHKGGGIASELTHKNGAFDVKFFLQNKNKHRKLHRQGKIHPNCIGCTNLKKQFWDSKDYINHVNFDTLTKCNANCIYCFTNEHKELYNSQPQHYIFEHVKQLVQNKILIPGGEVMFGGGEPTLSDEFEDLVNFLLDSGFCHIKVHSSGIKYSPAIERCLKEQKGDIIISPDAGSREIYEKIKQVPCYDIVWGNIKKYAQSLGNNKHQLITKYIILVGINDTSKDIDDFFTKNIESSIIDFRFDIELKWYAGNRDKIENLIPTFKLLKYIENKAKKFPDLKISFQAQAQTAINEHLYFWQTMD